MACPAGFSMRVLLQLHLVLDRVVSVVSACCINVLYACCIFVFYLSKEKNQLINVKRKPEEKCE